MGADWCLQSDVVPDLGLQVLLGAVGGPKWASNDIRYPLDLGLISRERERERDRDFIPICFWTRCS